MHTAILHQGNSGNSENNTAVRFGSSGWRSCAAALLTVIAASGWPSAPAWAQSGWTPSKPIRLVIPYPPGGATDVAARALIQKLGDSLGQPMVAENRPGANGMIASEVVYNASPDGYTLLIATADTNSINPNVYTTMRYQAREFRGVVPVAKVNFMLVARPAIKLKTLPELVALAKGGNLTFASWGVGSTSQAAMEMFKAQADLKILHVPYQGAAPAFQAVMADQVDIMMAPAVVVIPNLSKVAAFGIASPERFAGATQVPTLTEQGYPVDADAWVGILAPPKTPQAVIDHIHKHVSEVTKDPDFKKRLLDIGLSAMPPMGQEQFHNYMVSEIDRWGQVIRKAGIRLDN